MLNLQVTKAPFSNWSTVKLISDGIVKYVLIIYFNNTWKGPSWGLNVVEIKFKTKSKCLSNCWVWMQKLDILRFNIEIQNVTEIDFVDVAKAL